MKYFEYLFFMFQNALLSVMPFRLIYLFSDFSAFVLRKVVRYRIETVQRNLKNSFPEKEKKELDEIERQFYRNLSDIAVESIKGYSMGTAVLKKRYRFINMEVANRFYEMDQDIILAVSHFGNWEWGSQTAGLVFRHSLIAFYKPLTNKFIDKFVAANRTKRKINLIPVNKPKIPVRTRGQNPVAYLFISDQNPGIAKAYWSKFLNQDTAWYRGIETYARHYNMPVVYVHVKRISRGYYDVSLEVLVENPTLTLPGEITEKYIRKLESVINDKPADWLWSHRRWKRKIKTPLQGILKTGKITGKEHVQVD